jgi:hypothetical protein
MLSTASRSLVVVLSSALVLSACDAFIPGASNVDERPAERARSKTSKKPTKSPKETERPEAARRGSPQGKRPAPDQERAPRDRDDKERRPAPVAEAKGGGEPTVLFIVIDTVRSQSLSLCGYERPTTPFLEQLRDKTGAAWTCDAYSAATWTVPSHASYFTGLQVPAHESDTMGFSFSAEIPTLSEVMADKGYQTAMLTANPTLSRKSGLQRGFQHVKAAKTLVDIRGDDVRHELRGVLEEANPNQPLFMFVNLIDAHDPYPRIPSGLDWVPPRPELPFDVHDPDRNKPYHRYVRGEMPPKRAEEYLASVRDGYDYGIYLADKNVGAVMQTMRRDGWFKNGFRVVITSDHGEFLGEHQLLRHGCFTWEPVTKVPFLYYDSTVEEQITLPSPFSAINAFWLASEGKLPETPVAVASFSKRRQFDVKVGADMTSLWLPDQEKLIWKTDEYLHVDLGSDPDELSPSPLSDDHPRRPDLLELSDAHADHLRRIRSKKADPEMLKALEEIGYVE